MNDVVVALRSLSTTAELLISLGLLLLLTLAKTACANSGSFYSTIYKKFGFKKATNVLGSLTLPGPTGGAYITTTQR